LNYVAGNSEKKFLVEVSACRRQRILLQVHAVLGFQICHQISRAVVDLLARIAA